MNRRRIEIIALAALILATAIERPSMPGISVDLRPTIDAAGSFAPQRIDTACEFGRQALGLLARWIGHRI